MIVNQTFTWITCVWILNQSFKFEEIKETKWKKYKKIEVQSDNEGYVETEERQSY